MTSEINKSVFNTSFAEKDVVYSDGQINVMPLPEAIMANGFIPETRDAPGMPLAAQHLNWLFRDLYRRANQLDQLSASKDQLLPAWSPIPCPMAQPPAGYLKCNGAVFDKDKYPELAKGYPSGVLPDLRGEFIRGWDDGRGVDVAREVLSQQSHAFQRHNHFIWAFDGYGTSVFTPNDRNGDYILSTDNAITPNYPNPNGMLQTSRYVTEPSGNNTETRPRNIAFLYIVRAA